MSNIGMTVNSEMPKMCEQGRSATTAVTLECKWTGFLLLLMLYANKILQNYSIGLRMESDDPQYNVQQKEFEPQVETHLELITKQFLRSVIRFGNDLFLKSFLYRLTMEPKEEARK